MKDPNGQRRRAHGRSFLGRRRHGSRRPQRFRPNLEALEQRIVLSTPTVVSPQPHSNNAFLTNSVSVSYDFDIVESSVSDDTFLVSGSQSGTLLEPTNVFEGSGNVASVSLGTAIFYQPGEVVHATVTSGIGDPYVWQFRARSEGGSGFYTSGQSFGNFTTTSVAFGDLDGDADVDAFLSTTSGNRVWWNTSGTFSPGPSLGGSAANVVLGDFDGDGDIDAIADRFYRNRVNLTGTFDSGPSMTATSVGDIDGDGDLDVVGTTVQFNNLTPTSGSFTVGQSLGGKGYLGDLDTDGDLDLFVIKSGGQGNEVWLNNGNGVFTKTSQNLGSGNSQVAELGDLDNDGDLDAVVGNGSGQADRVWMNNGTGQFTDSGQILGSMSTSDLNLGDVDGDGDLDAVITSSDTRIWFNNGVGAFQLAPQVLNSASGTAAALGDVDKDGDLDILIGQNSPAQVWINSPVPQISQDIYENNDSSSAAASVNTSPYHFGNQLYREIPGLTVDRAADDDWYFYTAPETGQMTVSIEFAHAFGDLDLKLYDASLTQLDHSQSSSDVESITRNVTAGQQFYIQVFGANDATSPDYTLKVLGAVHRPDIFEGPSGNDSRGNAYNLGSGSQMINNLSIHNPGNDDWFRITAPTSGAINVELFFSHAQGDLDLEIRDQSGLLIDESASASDDEAVSFSAVAGLTYYIKVIGFEGDTNPNYSLRVNTGNGGPEFIVPVPDRTINEDSTTGSLSFRVRDDVTPANNIVVTAFSNNTTLVPDGNVLLGGSGENRTVVVNPAPNRSGTATITVLANDGMGGIASDEFTVTVLAVADMPHLNVSDAAGAEDSEIPLSISAVLSDADGSETLSVIVSGVPIGANLSAGTNNGGGTWTLTAGNLSNLRITPAPNDASDFTLTITARATETSNNDVATVSDTLHVVVESGDDAPTISNITDRTINEDTTTGAIGFIIGDAETPAEQLIVSATSNNQTVIPNSNLILTGTGAARAINVVPAPEQSSTTPVEITVRVSDGVNITEETFNVTVVRVDDPPIISSIPDQFIDEDTSTGAIAFTISDVDTPIGSLTVSATSSDQTKVPNSNIGLGGSGGSRTINVSPAPNATGPVMITIRVTGGGAASTETFTVNIRDVNDAPVLSSIDDRIIDEDTPTGNIAFTVSDEETPAGSLTVTARSSNQAIIPNTNLTLSGAGNNRQLNVVPASNQNGGPVTITVEANDGSRSATETFTVMVTPVNDAPIVVDPVADFTIDQGVTRHEIDLAPVFDDVDIATDGDSLSYFTGFNSNPSLVTPSVVGTTLVLNFAENQSGSAQIYYRARDNGIPKLTAERSFVVTVSPNAAPTISSIADRTTPEDTPIGAIGFTVSDAETPASSLTVTATSSNQALIPDANLTLGGSGTSRNLTVTPAADQHGGPVTITVRVSDGTSSATDTFTVTISSVNDVPTITSIPGQTTDEDVAVGPISFTVGDVETAATALTVTATSDNQTLIPNGNLNVGGSGAARSLTITPAANRSGTANITVTVDDGTDQRTTTFPLTVNPVNDAPTISDITNKVINEDTSTGAISFTVGDVETPLNSLVVSATSSNPGLIPNGNITLGGSNASRTITLMPAANRSGTATITVTVDDGDRTSSDTFTVTVTAVNDAPVNTVPGPRSTPMNTPLVLSNATAISVSDVDAGANDVSVELDVDHGTLDLSTTSGLSSVTGDGTGSVTLRGPITSINAALNGLTYTPATGFAQTDTLTVTTNDLGNTGSGGPRTDTDVVSVAVNNVNDPPQITSSDTVSVREGTTNVMTVTATDPDGDTPTFSIVGGADQAEFGINSITGRLSFDSPKSAANPDDANGDGVYEVAVRASDGNGGTDQQTILVTVTDNTAPTANIVSVSPNPRAGAVGSINVVFSEAVTGFDVSDLSLVRRSDSTVSLLPGSATVTTADNITWTVGNLTSLTSGSGIYELTLNSAGSGIRDMSGVSLAAGDSESWINGPGDANEDRKFDQFDLILILQGGQYLSGQPATWSEGDFNGDGVFNQGDLIVTLQPNHFLKGSFGAMNPQVVDADAADVTDEALIPPTTGDVVGTTDATDAVFEAVDAVNLDGDPLVMEDRIDYHPLPIESLLIDVTLAKRTADSDALFDEQGL